jgi:hypothetical protein
MMKEHTKAGGPTAIRASTSTTAKEEEEGISPQCDLYKLDEKLNIKIFAVIDLATPPIAPLSPKLR